MSKIGDDIRKIEKWFAKEEVVLENDLHKVAVFITAKLDPEIEKLIANGTIIVAEKVVDAITASNVGDVIGAALIKEWPIIVQVAQDVQKVLANLPVLKTMIAAQIAMILNTYRQNPSAPFIQSFIVGVETAVQDLIKDVETVIETNP